MLRLLIILLFSLNAAYAQVDTFRAQTIRKAPANKNIRLTGNTAPITIAYRTLDLDTPVNAVLKNIFNATTNTLSIYKLLLETMKTKDLPAYFDAKPSPRILTSDDVERFMQDSSIHVSHLLIYEQWLLDRNSMRMVNRIVSIAPAFSKSDNEFQPLFWVKYDDVEQLFLTTQVYKSTKKHNAISLNDFFQKRMFLSELLRVKTE